MAERFEGRGGDKSALRKGKERKDKIDLPNWNGAFGLQDAPARLHRNCSSYTGARSARLRWCWQGEFKEPCHSYGTVVDIASASYWICKASNAEAKGKYQDAANILMEGKSKGAQPETDLDRGLEDIQQRWRAVKDFEEREAVEKVECGIQRFSQFSGSRTVTPRFKTTIPIPLALTQSNPSTLDSRPGTAPILPILSGRKRSSVRFKSEVQVIEPADESHLLAEARFPAQIAQALALPTVAAVEHVAEPGVAGCQPADPSAPGAPYSPMQTSPAPAIDATGTQKPKLQGVRLNFQSVLDSEQPCSRDDSKVLIGGVCRQGNEHMGGDVAGPATLSTKDVLARMLGQVFCATICKMETGQDYVPHVAMDAPICRYDVDSRKTKHLNLGRMCVNGLREDLNDSMVSRTEPGGSDRVSKSTGLEKCEQGQWRCSMLGQLGPLQHMEFMAKGGAQQCHGRIQAAQAGCGDSQSHVFGNCPGATVSTASSWGPPSLGLAVSTPSPLLRTSNSSVPGDKEAQCSLQWQRSPRAPGVEGQLSRPAATARQHPTGAQDKFGAFVFDLKPNDGQFTGASNRFPADGCGNLPGAPFPCFGPNVYNGSSTDQDGSAKLGMASEGGPMVTPSISGSNNYCLAPRSLLQRHLWRAGDPTVQPDSSQPLGPPLCSAPTHPPVNTSAHVLSKQRNKGMAARCMPALPSRQVPPNSSRAQPKKLQPRPPWRHSTQGQARSHPYTGVGVRGDVVGWPANGRSQTWRAGGQRHGKIHHRPHLHEADVRARRVRNGVGIVSKTAALPAAETREAQQSSRQLGPLHEVRRSGFRATQQAASNAEGAREMGNHCRTAKVPRCAGRPGKT
ncbi:unnamed protein product [Ostreobium quekettii]|uniref:Uncharacterized protein n=1 Tax=Ostreobium quekettii TaxID=121088 RepID=A0A8S1JB50_9CHLO|nr:unnamed protein product [Ostreobium quekettii]|eukprot:evm.model.scf_404.1 EVM.evm.TU.scf_404.1   scf_404:7450-19877(-)